MYSPKIYGYGVAVVCAVIAVAPRICRGGRRGVDSLTHGRFNDNSRYAARPQNEASWQAISKGHVGQPQR